MAKTIIREYDMSQGVMGAVSDFAVVVPGFANPAVLEVGESKIYTLTSVDAFNKTIGKVAAKNCGGHLGNQIAYELLTLGYKVYFKTIKVEYTSVTVNNETVQKEDWAASLAALKTVAFWELFKDNKVYRDVRYLISGLDPDDATDISDSYAPVTIKSAKIFTEYLENFVLYKFNAVSGEYDLVTVFDPGVTQYYFKTSLIGAVGQVMNDIVNFINKPKAEDQEPDWDADNGRGDAIALIDFPQKDIVDSTHANLLATTRHAIDSLGNLSRYSAIFGPKVTYIKDVEESYNNNATLPASFHYLACAAYSQERFAEWYAVAGYNRGICRYTVASADFNYGNLIVNKIAPRQAIGEDSSVTAANLVINERGNYYLWGNRTAEPLTAKGLRYRHFLNIRQLCTSIKKQILYATNNLEFEPNSDHLWLEFKGAITPLLDRMKADQGIRDYDLTRKTNQSLAVMSARLRIIPIEAVEDFDINLGLVDNLAGGSDVILSEE